MARRLKLVIIEERMNELLHTRPPKCSSKRESHLIAWPPSCTFYKVEYTSHHTELCDHILRIPIYLSPHRASRLPFTQSSTPPATLSSMLIFCAIEYISHRVQTPRLHLTCQVYYLPRLSSMLTYNQEPIPKIYFSTSFILKDSQGPFWNKWPLKNHGLMERVKYTRPKKPTRLSPRRMSPH